MILAAGRGERMRPLTDHTPKALLQVGGEPLLFRHLWRLSRAGYRRVVINHAHLGQQIEAAVGTGERWGLEIRFSPEPRALETAGGIANALPLIGADAFTVVNADVYTDCDFAPLRERTGAMSAGASVLAHLLLVNNPEHHPGGDFALVRGLVRDQQAGRLTFAGLGVYRRELFANVAAQTPAPLAPLLKQAMVRQQVTGEHFRGRWFDIGTPERLDAVGRLVAEQRD
jgi:N-acetyl-alpha-D-muramate 1-phosphate uridylyltransferase